MLLKCKRCHKIWDYNGFNKYYCSCPNCKTSVKIQGYQEKYKEGLKQKKVKL